MKSLQSEKTQLWLQRSLLVECLYIATGKLQQPLKELSAETKSAKTRLKVTLQEAQGPCVRNCGAKADGGRKTNIQKGIKEARAKIETEEVVKI